MTGNPMTDMSAAGLIAIRQIEEDITERRDAGATIEDIVLYILDFRHAAEAVIAEMPDGDVALRHVNQTFDDDASADQ